MKRTEIIRFPSREVRIGGLPVGARHPFRLQSMTNTPTTDVKATLEQCQKTFEAGADYMRISIPDKASLEAFREIKKKLRAAGCFKPLIADIHFRALLALEAAKIADKVRINPGNYTPDHHQKNKWTTADFVEETDTIRNKLRPLVLVCHDHGTAIRVGTNAGSLSPRIIYHYGHTPEALAVSTMEYLRILEELNFHQVVLSLKASNPYTTIRAYSLLAKMMLGENKCYPLHTGVTEAGDGISGRTRSALGVIPLLQQGIGDTIRISLTEKPESEIHFLKELVTPFQTTTQKTARTTTYVLPEFQEAALPPPPLPDGHKAFVFTNEASSPDKLETFCHYILSEWPDKRWKNKLQKEPHSIMVAAIDKGFPASSLPKLFENVGKKGIHAAVIARICMEETETGRQIIRLAMDFGSLLLQKKLHGFWIQNNKHATDIASLALELLQAAGLRFSKTSFISCPGCARTSFAIEEVLNKVKDQLSERPGMTIAVMGCVVNGPGEMAGADYGLLGQANGKLQVFYKGKALHKNLDPEKAITQLNKLIQQTNPMK